MNIGDKVTINKKMVDNDPGPHPKTWTVVNIEPTDVIFLGTGQRWDGKWVDNYSGTYDEHFYVNTKCHNVYIVQPIDKGKRYRLPIAVPKDGVQA